MSTKQLQSYLGRLNAFTSRSTSYVAGLHGTPLSGSAWRQYQRAEKQYNAKSNSFYDSIKDHEIPTLGRTVAEYLSDLRGGTDSRPRRDGDYRSFGEMNRTAGGITSEKSLKRLLVQMEKRADPNYLEKEAKLQRRILRKMLKRTGNNALNKLVKDMSDEEIITLTQYTEFMDKLEGSYAMSKSTSTDRPAWQSSVFEDNEDSINSLIDWAHRHFTDQDDSEQDTDDSRTTATRDRYGRFIRKDQRLPEPDFVRDEHGRFAPRS